MKINISYFRWAWKKLLVLSLIAIFLAWRTTPRTYNLDGRIYESFSFSGFVYTSLALIAGSFIGLYIGYKIKKAIDEEPVKSNSK